MARRDNSWLVGRLQRAIANGFSKAYVRVRVDPNAYLNHVRRAYRLPIQSFDDMFSLPQETVDNLADQTISGAMKFAALEGTGFGLGGLLTVIPDMGILAAIAVRMLQKLSLLYGFTYSTEEEEAMLWIAAATAAGVDFGRELIEKEAVERFVPRVVERIAVKLGAEVAEKWSARIVPVVSGALGGTLNYYFIRAWGQRAKEHFRERHLEERLRMGLPVDFGRQGAGRSRAPRLEPGPIQS
jgi:uncharacterized protein (DUF697 family)